MNDYVDQIGNLKPKHFKKKDMGDLRDLALKKLGGHTNDLREMDEERRNITIEDMGGPCSKASIFFYLLVCKEIFTGVLIPLFDMGSDIATAVTHMIWNNYGWGALTLVFVWLPGFVAALAITIRGLRKDFTFQRTINYMIVLAALPFLYPFIQMMVNCYMVYLMIVQRSTEIVKIMGHDVKQFKSLEGFLESGPQFVLQSYILLRGEKEGIDDFRSAESLRLAMLSISVIISYISLTKTGFNVNVPDPDKNRNAMQYPENASKFTLTSIPFHFVCVLFRVSCLAYFFATIRYWTFFVIIVLVAANYGLLLLNGATHTISIILAFVSIFMPNGYLLYNFAATFMVDFSLQGTMNYFMYNMLLMTGSFLTCIITVFASGASEWLMNNIPGNSVLNEDAVQLGMNISLMILGLLSVALAWVHWRFSIEPLYSLDDNAEAEERAQMSGGEEATDA